MRTMIIGANGQLGTDLVRVLSAGGDMEVFGLTHSDVEVTSQKSVEQVFERIRPDVVLNTAAFHQTDLCESEAGRSFQVNAEAVKILADNSVRYRSILAHFSTDYVFDGRSNSPYTEKDCPNPISLYGVSKLAGEQILRYVTERHYIFRVSGLYGIAGSRAKGYNFVDIMIRMAREGKDLKVVDDQVLTPTYTLDIARKVREVVATGKFGTYHLTNAGGCSWFDFTRTILDLCGLAGTKLQPVKTGHFGEKARRPAFSVLDNRYLRENGFQEMPEWKDALGRYLAEKGYIHDGSADPRGGDSRLPGTI